MSEYIPDAEAIAQDELERLLRKATKEELIEVAEGNTLELGDLSEFSKIQILRKFQEIFDAYDGPQSERIQMLEQFICPARLSDEISYFHLILAGLKKKVEVSTVKNLDDIIQENGDLPSLAVDQKALQMLQEQQQKLLELQQQLTEDEAGDIQKDLRNRKLPVDTKNQIDLEMENRLRREYELRRMIEEEYSQKERKYSNVSTVDAIRTLDFKRELKIQGTIGGKTETRLNYISLQSQVSEATTRGYSNEEIKFALRRAVATGSELRQYLDTLEADISLDEVLGYIRGAYKEKTAGELFQDLNKLCQNSSEDNQSFLFRALSLRQKMIAASKVEDAINYGTDLIQSVFKRSVLTGLRDDAIRAHMKLFLSSSAKKTDQELIEEISKVSAEETEHMSKQVGSTSKRVSFRAEASCSTEANGNERRARVNEITGGSESSRTSHAAKACEMAHVTIESQVKNAVKPLTDTIRELSLQLSSMQKELEEMKQRRHTSAKKQKRLGCSACLANNITCKHCFRCGKEGHRIASCPNSSN